jgi:CheY-like chemotaxis protein
MSNYILAAVDDMFFAAKIRGTAEQIGLEVYFTKTVEAAIEKARVDSPRLIIADLHSAKLDPFALATELKMDESLRRIPLIGFFSHVQMELQTRAEEAGFDKVMPRSAFSKRLPEILQS